MGNKVAICGVNVPLLSATAMSLALGVSSMAFAFLRRKIHRLRGKLRRVRGLRKLPDRLAAFEEAWQRHLCCEHTGWQAPPTRGRQPMECRAGAQRQAERAVRGHGYHWVGEAVTLSPTGWHARAGPKRTSSPRARSRRRGGE
jgi:hypothetical protein